MSGHLIAVYIFGSVGRNQQDSKSDLDILAVVQNGTGKVSDETILTHIPDALKHLKISVSWYGGDRLKEMFANGELFAWHLFRETIPLHDPTNFLQSLGSPANYTDATIDVISFHKVLKQIPHQISSQRGNSIYECGLVYVCIRNIAMAASWHLCSGPDFSRYSAFNLGRECPISRDDFDNAMACRMASQRGMPPPEGISCEYVIRLFSALDPWVEQLISELSMEEKHGR